MSLSGLPSTPPIQSIQRAAAIMRCFTEVEPELSVTELSHRLELHKSTVSRMLATLQHERLVERNPKTGEYRLGLGLISLAGVALGRLNARAAAQPYLDSLVKITRETINVTVLDGQECINIERAFSPQPVRYMGWIGRRTPLHCTASGKVLLAGMSPEGQTSVSPPPLSHHTDKTITDIEELTQSLQLVRQQGYAIVHGEYEDEISSLAAPIYNHLGQVIATLAITGPTYRLQEEAIKAFVEPLLQITQQISADLGYSGLK
ncbi:MAG: IclR family transcriptional regulator [Chloroflexi bacterium]|nr:IclR family transcriptional regulator [Chloroflexota bacterium]